jgi:hypothetical protein
VGHRMEDKIELTAHDHVKVAVKGASTKGVELVPAQHLGDEKWLLLRSPLYAVELAAGDTIRANEAGAFEIISRGGNVAVHFYLPESDLDDAQATNAAADDLSPRVAALKGRLDGKTSGLMVFTIPIEATFQAVEDLFAAAVSERPGAQWQFANVYDLVTGEPLRWWD